MTTNATSSPASLVPAPTTPAETLVPADSIVITVYRAALAKLNECRERCPGIGGDMDAANLTWLIRQKTFAPSAAAQAARTLESLARGLDIDAASEVAALRNLQSLIAAPDLLDACLAALPYVEDVLDNPAQLAGFKRGAVQKDARLIRAAIAKTDAPAPPRS